MKFIVIFLLGLTVFTTTQAIATEGANRNIASLGVESLGYVQFKEGLSQPCQFGVVCLPDFSQYNARAMMAVLVAAQTRGAPVTITYDMASTGFCTASKVLS